MTDAKDNIAKLREQFRSSGVLTKAQGDEDFGKYMQRWSDIGKKEPAVVVLPRSEDECRLVVEFAAVYNVPFAVKSGGMSLYSTIGEDGILIDLSEYYGVEHDKDSKTAVLVGSVSAKVVAMRLAEDRCCTTLPSANTVGAIPFFLNGGNSALVSQLGYGSDLIVSARLITAQGKLVDVDESSQPDLLYAIRGAGQYLGLITQLTIRTFSFEETLDNEEGTIWSGRFVFPLDRADEVFESMRTIVSDASFATSGLIMIAAPPPALRPAVVVLPKLVGKTAGNLQQQAFKSLYDLQPLAAGGSDVPVQNMADILAPLCASGGYKKLVLTGLNALEPTLWSEVVKIWQDMTTRFPDTINSFFSFQWDSRGPKMPLSESANALHHVKFWANNLIWYREAAEGVAVQSCLDRVIDVLRRNQKLDEYVDFFNSERGGPIERRYPGRARLEKLSALKSEWDPEQRFSTELL